MGQVKLVVVSSQNGLNIETELHDMWWHVCLLHWLDLSDCMHGFVCVCSDLKPAVSTQNGLSIETELRELREAVSNVTREAEYLKRQLDEAFAYIRQLEEQQATVLTDLASANSSAAAHASSVGAV